MNEHQSVVTTMSYLWKELTNYGISRDGSQNCECLSCEKKLKEQRQQRQRRGDIGRRLPNCHMEEEFSEFWLTLFQKVEWEPRIRGPR